MRLQAFNDAFKTIFSNKKDEDILYKHCGEAIGCAFQIEEGVDCGKTSQCVNCELRIAAFDAYFDGKIVYKEHIQRPFFDQNNQKVYKDLQFSTRKFHFNKDKYIVMMIEDITKIKQLERDLKSN